MNSPGFIFWFAVCVFHPLCGYSQLPSFQGEARSRGMANTRVMMANQWSALHNPAGLADLNQVALGIYYENYFQVPELGMGAFCLDIPTGHGSFGLASTTFGYSLFRQNQLSLAYGKSLGRFLKAGLGFNYLQIIQPAGYGNLSAVVPGFGIQWVWRKKITAGFQFFNPARQHYISAESMPVCSFFSAGIGYNLGDEVLLCAEAEKIFNERILLYGGFEALLHDKIFIRFGISSSEFQKFSCGIGYKSRALNIDFAVTKHPVLQYNSAITISYQLDQKGKSNLLEL